jgi:hypothetical protein
MCIQVLLPDKLGHKCPLRRWEEERVTLLVNPKAGDGKVQAVYERWGYEKIGEQQPFADSPVFAAMMREPLHRT